MRSILFFLCFLAFANTGFAQDNYDVDLIPGNLRNRANSCIRNEETVVDMRAPENVMLTVKKAITVFNENGEDEARLVLYYDKNTAIKGIKGEVYNAVGKPISKFTQSDFADVSAADGFSLFMDSRVKHYLPNVNQYPYTIVYNYEIRNKQNLIIPRWIPKPAHDVSVEKSSYTFISKPTDEVRIKTLNYTGSPEVVTDEKQKKMIWKIDNIVAIKPEPYSPDPETYRTSVQIAPKHFFYYNHKGTYQNWEELGKWIYADLLKQRNILPPATIQMVQELVKDEKTDKDKARKIYQYLQNKTRYISVQIGIGGFQPIAASEVDRLGYGDCKALVNYMQSMLNAVNIESYYCVVEAGNEKKGVDPKFADMTQGNHIILCMPLKGDTTWLECTSQKIPFGYLGDFTDDRLVLACTADGGKLLRTPKLTAKNNLQIRNVELKINESGTATGNMNTVFSGSQYDNHESLIGKSITEQHKSLKVSYNVDNIDFETVVFAQEKNIDPKLTEDIKVNIRNYAPINGNKMYLQLNAFNITRSIPEIKNRILPVYINRGFTDEDTITYLLPENVQTDDIIPENKSFKNDFGLYQVKVTIEGKKLIYYRKLMINDGTFPASKYEEFSKFMSNVNAADYLKLALSLKK
ncbi:DUF3857 domain-containing protein [Pedobacter chinensis]|uniref:DUF3857 domain-containing protein n=1 Tax=Pedobacter chinensis TaxID=2282421 RepID=A0A369Q165_9SPHI|nr:DUF3857 domain-containing transglutaminase family protein [Pedobacter chinensis]RDC58623.1 DUF3857 domain-containing protein [Pedobacter chinensis]